MAERPHWVVWVAIGVGAVLAAGAGALIARATDDDHSEHPSATGSSSCSITSVAEQGLPSVVKITVLQGGQPAGNGSGEVIRPDGEILTNNHVISAAANGAGTITVLFNNGTTTDAHIVGRDPQTDLAVIKLDGNGDHLHVIPFGRSADLRVGQHVIALGAPLGFPDTVTSGIVSALGRSVQVPSDGGNTALLAAAIQTDTAINPGNSGGALMDCHARLVGIPTAGAVVPGSGSSGGSIGIGFAIPSDFAKRISDEIISTGRVTHAYLGLQVAETTPTGSRQRGASPSGLFVVAVDPGGPSDLAGIRPGDIITEIDGKPAASTQQLLELTLTKQPGDTARLGFERDGTAATATLTLTAPPGSNGG